MPWDQEKHFGMAESAFETALKANNLHRDGIYVPTITEVASAEPQMLRCSGRLAGWLTF